MNIWTPKLDNKKRPVMVWLHGGAKVLSLTAMPAVKGLFHKAIVQSGAVELIGMSLQTPDTSRRVAELTLQILLTFKPQKNLVPKKCIFCSSKRYPASNRHCCERMDDS